MGVVFDTTVETEVSGIAVMQQAYHLWDLDGAGQLLDSIHWANATSIVQTGADLILDIEPDLDGHGADERPLDPKFATLAAITETHQILAVKLEPLCELAQTTGSRIFPFRFLSLKRLRDEDIVNDSAEWIQHLTEVVNIDGGLIADMVRSTRGGECIDCYNSSAWNVDHYATYAKTNLLVDRQRSALRRLGLNSLPALYPFEVGGAGGEMSINLWASQVFTARGAGDCVVWNGDFASGFAAFPESHKPMLL